MALRYVVNFGDLTVLGAGLPRDMDFGPKLFQAGMSVTSGSGSASVSIEGSIDGKYWSSLAALSVTDTAADSVYVDKTGYLVYRANVTALTGTGATVSVKGIVYPQGATAS